MKAQLRGTLVHVWNKPSQDNVTCIGHALFGCVVHNNMCSANCYIYIYIGSDCI